MIDQETVVQIVAGGLTGLVFEEVIRKAIRGGRTNLRDVQFTLVVNVLLLCFALWRQSEFGIAMWTVAIIYSIWHWWDDDETKRRRRLAREAQRFRTAPQT